MDNSANKSAPSLWVWLGFAVLALAFLGGLLQRTLSNKALSFRERTTYVQAKLQTAQGKAVLLIGSSLTGCAYDSCAKIERFIESATGQKITLLKLWRNATNLQSFMEAMPVLQQVHPACVIVEANLLCYSAEERLSIMDIQHTLHDLLTGTPHKPFRPEEKPEIAPLKTPMPRQLKVVVDTAQLSAFKQFAAQLQTKGIRIILVNIPVEASEERKKWSSPDAVLFKRNFDYLAKDVSFVYWDPQQYWDRNFYIDFGHLNARGTAAFTDWFCCQLAKEVEQL